MEERTIHFILKSKSLFTQKGKVKKVAQSILSTLHRILYLHNPSFLLFDLALTSLTNKDEIYTGSKFSMLHLRLEFLK